MLRANTPVERHVLYHREKGEIPFYVKREDMACAPPGPPFAKIRGLSIYMQALQREGVETVGYMDTSISMAGWGIAYLAQQLGMRAVLFYPAYKGGLKRNQPMQLKMWKYFDAEIVPMQKPTMHSI